MSERGGARKPSPVALYLRPEETEDEKEHRVSGSEEEMRHLVHMGFGSCASPRQDGL